MAAIFDYPYRKSVNITAWVLQFIVCLILLGASAWVIAATTEWDLDSLYATSAGIQIGITGVTIIFDIVEIVLIAKKRMPPALYLASACIKSFIWVIILILNLIALSALAIILTAILAITSITQLVYGAILVHRKRRGTLRGGNYAPAANPAMAVETGYGGAYVDPAADRYYQAPDPVSAPEYKSQSAYSAFPAPAPAPAPAYSTAPAQNYGQTQSGSYELDNRVHG